MSESTTTAQTPAVPLPSQEEIDAALRTLMRAWNPGVLLPGDLGHQDADYYDPDERCNCAGETEDGESRGCNCGDACVCDSCSYYRYARAKSCDATPHTTSLDTRCGRPTRYRVVGWRLEADWTRDASAAECGHSPEEDCWCGNGVVYASAGPVPRELRSLTACSVEHAQALIAHLRATYAEPDDKPNRVRWRFERWTYVLHDQELAAPLPMLRELTSIAHDSTGYAVKAYAENGPVAMWLDSVRSALARAVWHAAKPLERLDEDDDTADDDAPAPARQKPGEPHQCPALPGQLHAVVTVGATVQDVHFAGLYEDPEAAADHVSGYAAHAKHLSDRHVKPAPGCPGEMLLELPEKRERHGVQLAVVVPLQVLSDPRGEDEVSVFVAGDYSDDYYETGDQ
uniref:Uncharacterized protein n=1 Tax=Streptomyces sp. NBC_00093 TaxID=2975649 RepID=A0AAU2A0E8_9ACTN